MGKRTRSRSPAKASSGKFRRRPNGKRSWKHRGSRSGKRRRSRSTGGRGVVRNKSSNFVVPQSLKRTLVYHETVTIDAGAASYVTALYGANNVYDPRTAVGGHQPMGFDQLIALYRFATVIGSRITVVPTGASVANTVPCYVTIFLSEDGNAASTLASPESFWESQLRASGIVQTGEGGGKSWNFLENNTCVATYSAKKFHKVSSLLGQSIYQNTAGLPPTRTPQYEVVAWSVNGNDPAGTILEIHIEYEVVFTEPYPIVGS